MESESPGATRHEVTSHLGGAGLPPWGWGTSFILGLITLILGAVIVSRPAHTLIAVAVLLGVVMIVSGVYQIARALSGREHERVWRGISGVVFLLTGLTLLRHLDLSVALIGLFIGFTWIIQGVLTLMECFSPRRRRGETGWSVFFGIISLIAGIVVVTAPIASVRALTIFMGIWFIVLGAFEVLGSLAARRAMSRQASEGMRVPGQRSGVADTESGAGTTEDVTGQGTVVQGSTGVQSTGGQGTGGESRPASRNTRG